MLTSLYFKITSPKPIGFGWGGGGKKFLASNAENLIQGPKFFVGRSLGISTSTQTPHSTKKYLHTSQAQKSISKFSKNGHFSPKTMLKYCCKISGVCTTFQAKKNFS